MKKLKRFSYTANGLIIRPAISTYEIITEGKILNHCVGGYIEFYANGRTNLFFIRKQENPQDPFYTVEIDKDMKKIIQCRGRRNKNPTPEVKVFIEEYEKFLRK